MAELKHYMIDGTSARELYPTLPLPRRKQRLPEPPPKPEIKMKKKLAISPFAVMGTAVALLMLFLVIFNYVRTFELRNEVKELQARQEELTQEKLHLEAKYEGSIDLRTVAKRAKALGMHKPMAGQIIYLEPQTNQTAQRYTAAEEPGFPERIMDAFRDLFTDMKEYFS